MTAENFDDALKLLTQKIPYQIFAVELNGGQRFEIDFPGALGFRKGVAVFFTPGGAPVMFDHDSVNAIIAGPANTSI